MKNNQTVNHPSYYLRNGKECIDFIDSFIGDEFSYGCVFKYLWRCGTKDDESLEKDQQKALWYFDHIVNNIYNDIHKNQSTTDISISKCRTIVFNILRNMFNAANIPEAIEFLQKNRMED